MHGLSEDWPESRGRRRPPPRAMICECRRCRDRGERRYVERLADQSLSTALRHAQDPVEDGWEAGLAGAAIPFTTGPVAPAVNWSAPATLQQILDKKGKEFERVGRYRIYKITRDMKDLYFGIVYGREQSVANRIRSHHNIKTKKSPLTSEVAKLHNFLQVRKKDTFARFTEVRAAPGHRIGPKYLHAMELLLQTKFKPEVFIDRVLTFEEDEDDAFAW